MPSKTVVIVSIIIIIVAISPVLAKSEAYTRYISVISSFGAILTLLGFVFTIYTYEQNQEQRDEDAFIQNAQRNWSSVEKEVSDSFPYLDRYYNQLYSLQNNIVYTSDEEIEARSKERHFSEELFQQIENILPDIKDQEDRSYGWPAIFKMWGKSQIFKDNWKDSKSFYNPETQDYINKLVL